MIIITIAIYSLLSNAVNGSDCTASNGYNGMSNQ
jgi:hypothetical protein